MAEKSSFGEIEVKYLRPGDIHWNDGGLRPADMELVISVRKSRRKNMMIVRFLNGQKCFWYAWARIQVFHRYE